MSVPATQTKFSRKDLAEIVMGCCSMAFPVASAEEIWKFGQELSFARVLIFGLASLLFVAVIIHQVYHAGEGKLDGGEFLRRVFSTYGLTLVISALILFGLDRLDLMVDPWVGVKRTILVAFPASFAATVVDSIR